MSYTFGTSITAVNRLKEIAKFFNPLAREWISSNLKKSVDTALDLGSGPGFSTDMLYRAAHPSRVYGLESSYEFINYATWNFRHCFFMQHNVTMTPFPISADVIYSRFLLSHLPDIEKTVNSWVAQLKDGGTLFLDEVESVESEIPAFRKYLEVNKALISTQGAKLFVGDVLAHTRFDAHIVSNETAVLPVESCKAASWFYPNTVSVWEKEPYVSCIISKQEIKEISNELKQIMESMNNEIKTVWKMRRLVLRKK